MNILCILTERARERERERERERQRDRECDINEFLYACNCKHFKDLSSIHAYKYLQTFSSFVSHFNTCYCNHCYCTSSSNVL